MHYHHISSEEWKKTVDCLAFLFAYFVDCKYNFKKVDNFFRLLCCFDW